MERLGTDYTLFSFMFLSMSMKSRFKWHTRPFETCNLKISMCVLEIKQDIWILKLKVLIPYSHRVAYRINLN